MDCRDLPRSLQSREAVLKLFKVRQQRGPLALRHKRAIEDQAVRLKKWWQAGRRIPSSRALKHCVVVVKHLLERRRGVVVKVGGGLADSAQLGDVHYSEVRDLPRQ